MSYCRVADDSEHKPILAVRREDNGELVERVECDECGDPLDITVEEYIK